ncbi:hypothetical protein GIB67_041949 [Kingdonia uniflora]|uniref:MULE transposase domain-containing protein n=1 Tax=Kingdonia uniflora TaxID=39325 RepID=A0A7J7NZK9_9MAGN|nr:hypothetical protein GIB67_041949 [Kingdonia uniflora]
MVKKKKSKKSSKMQLRDEVGDNDSSPITVPNNTVDNYPPPDLEETRMRLSIPKPRHTYDLRDVFINNRGKWGKISPTGWVENDYKGGKSFKFRILCGEGINYEKFIRDIADKPTDVLREIVDEAGEYFLLEEDEKDYIISPRETKKKNTTPVKKDAKRKGKASDKEIDPEKITDYGIETPVNMVVESESECDNIDEEQERWVRYSQVGIDCLGAEDGYYSTHSSDDEDYVPTAEELEIGDDFEGVDVELDDIYSKEEDGRVKTPLEVGFKQLEHSCEGRLGVENTLCNTPWVTREVEALVRDVRAMTPKAIKTRMKTKFGVEISYWTAWNARQICMESIVGSSLNGFVKGCRPILGLDGCFLKGKYGGVCLSVLSVDANNGLFLIGVYMCRTECKDSWADFLTKVEPYLSAHPGKLTFISDRQKGLIDSVAEIFPHANHRRTKAESWDQGGLVPRAVKHLEYLMAHYGSMRWKEPPYVVDSPPLQRGRGRPRKERIRDDEVNKVQKKCGKCGAFGHNKKACKDGGLQSSGRASNTGRGRGRSASTPIAGGVQITPIARGRGSSGRASNAGRGRGRSASTPIAGGVQTTPIAGGRGSSGKASNAGRGRGRAMQTNHQRFVDEWLSNSVPVEAPQSQERPPLVIPPMSLRTDAPTKPYKKAFKPPRQNWRL